MVKRGLGHLSQSLSCLIDSFRFLKNANIKSEIKSEYCVISHLFATLYLLINFLRVIFARVFRSYSLEL